MMLQRGGIMASSAKSFMPVMTEIFGLASQRMCIRRPNDQPAPTVEKPNGGVAEDSQIPNNQLNRSTKISEKSVTTQDQNFLNSELASKRKRHQGKPFQFHSNLHYQIDVAFNFEGLTNQNDFFLTVDR